MSYKQPKKNDLESLKQFSLKLRLIAVAVSCLIIVCVGLCFKHNAEMREQHRSDEIVRIKKINSQREAEQAERDRLQANEVARQQQIADSIRIANMPTYSIAEVHQMVRTKAPAYSWVYLWRMDYDNWIMT